MNKNLIISVLAIILLIGGVVYITKGSNTSVSTTATSTPDVVNDDDTNDSTANNENGAPSASKVSIVSVSDTSVIVTGNVKPNGALTSYWYEYGNTPSLGNKTSNQILGSGFTSIQAPGYITNLNANTTYYFRINAQNQFGTVNGSILNFKTTGPATQSVPEVVSGDVTSITANNATLHGTVKPNGLETTYWFEYSRDSFTGSISGSIVSVVTATKKTKISGTRDISSVTANLSRLTKGSTYYYRIVAQNNLGIAHGSTLSFSTK